MLDGDPAAHGGGAATANFSTHFALARSPISAAAEHFRTDGFVCGVVDRFNRESEVWNISYGTVREMKTVTTLCR